MLRRGEVLLCALAELITLAPVLTLLSGIGPLTDDRSARRAPAASAAPRSDVWNGSGPRTLRGPPASIWPAEAIRHGSVSAAADSLNHRSNA